MKAKNPLTRIIDAGRAESPNEPVDEEVEEEFRAAEQIGRSYEVQARRAKENIVQDSELAAGDPDAAADLADAGDETVSGDNPTPDQSVVDELGIASGIVYEDAEPLHTAEKLEKRDTERWELDPASSEDYFRRNR